MLQLWWFEISKFEHKGEYTESNAGILGWSNQCLVGVSGTKWSNMLSSRKKKHIYQMAAKNICRIRAECGWSIPDVLTMFLPPYYEEVARVYSIAPRSVRSKGAPSTRTPLLNRSITSAQNIQVTIPKSRCDKIIICGTHLCWNRIVRYLLKKIFFTNTDRHVCFLDFCYAKIFCYYRKRVVAEATLKWFKRFFRLEKS